MEQDPLVNDVHRHAGRHQPAVGILALGRVGDDGAVPAADEVVAEQHELAPGRHLAPVNDGNGRRVPPPRPGVPGVEQGVEHVLPGRQAPDQVAAKKLPHRRQSPEDLRQGIAVAGARGGLGVVLGDPEIGPGLVEEGVEPRERTRHRPAGIGADQLGFPRLGTELGEDARVGHGRAPGRVECPEQQSALLPEQAVLGRGEEPGPEHGAERPVTEGQPGVAEPVLQQGGRLGAGRPGQAIVPGRDGVRRRGRDESAHAPAGFLGMRP
ncbi:MAG: hypothetical protein H6R40_1653 [Gemmatimonadetes bacterium]|nr:hypothetical protein [Gemmatimonadota bacterium]